MGLKRGIVKLEDYNNDWEMLYLKEKDLLCRLLKDYIIEIEHVGSTSIKGLKAKPIIDILIVISSLDLIPEIDNILKDYDYFNRGCQGVNDRMFFAKGDENNRTHYIHFTTYRSKTYYDLIYFKRYLLDNPIYIDKYAKLKEELALKYADDRKSYTANKDIFIKEIINLAKDVYND